MRSSAKVFVGTTRSIRHLSVRYLEARWDRTARVLLFSGGLEFDYELGRYPPAVFDIDALGLGPLTDFGGVQSVRLGFGVRRGLAAWRWR